MTHPYSTRLARLFMTGLPLALATTATATPIDLYAWDTPDPQTQLYQDATDLPAGMGGLFVPRLSADGDEPPYYVVSGSEVYPAEVGRRLALPPGRYVVLVGSTEPQLSAKTSVQILEGQTTLVPVTHGGLRLDLVDRQGRPTHSAELVLIQEESGETVASWAPDSPTRTLLLRPGAYRLQRPDSDGHTAPDFATVWVPEGGLTHLRVFVDNQGDLLGTGVIPRDEVISRESPDTSRWRYTLALGADGSIDQKRGVIGRPDLTLATGSVFAHGQATYNHAAHLLKIKGGLDEGAMLLQPSTGRPLPLIKANDKLQADLDYTLLFNEGVGLYGRAGGETQLLPWDAVTAQPTELLFIQNDGTTQRQVLQGGETYRLAEGLSPLLLHAGTGARVRLSTLQNLELSVHGGVGVRSYTFGGAYMPVDDVNTPEVEYLQVKDIQRAGLETGLTATVHLAHLLTYTTDLNVFANPSNLDNYILAWDNDLTMAITRVLSVNYRAHIDQLPEISDQVQINQGMFIRASWNIL